MLTLALTLALHAAPAQLTVELKPPETELIVDGKKKGKGTKALVLKLAPGKHVLRVVYKGDAHEEEIVLKAGQKQTWKWEFEGATPKKPDSPDAPEAPTDEVVAP